MNRVAAYLRTPVLFAILALLVGVPPSADARPAEPDDVQQANPTGPVKRSLVVESEYDALRVAPDPDLSPRGAITIEAWVKRRPGSGCGTIAGRDRAEAWWFAVCDGRLRFTPGGGEGRAENGQGLLPEGRWAHVAVTYDAASRALAFYIDGVLDRQTSLQGPLVGGDAELVLGADVTPGAAMDGKLDLVRLWSVARSASDVRDERGEVLTRQPGLVAQWPLDGSARDLAGGHDGETVSGASYSFDGAQPRDVTIPLSETVPQVDGRCDPAEYGSAGRVAIDTLEAPRVLLQASEDDLYVCLSDLPRGTGLNGFAAIYVDLNNSASALAGTGDLRISVNGRGTTDTEEGDGRGGWRDVDLLDADWDAERYSPGTQQQQPFWSAEFRLRRSLLDSPSDPDDPVVFGLAVGSSRDTLNDADAFWPTGTAQASPASWARAEMADRVGIPPRTRFEGRVIRRTDEPGPAEGLPGAVVQLLGVDEDRVILLDEDRVDGGGYWDLAYPGVLPDAFVVREVDPRGVRSVSAETADGGQARGANVLYYEVDPDRPDEGLRHEGALFVDEISLAEPEPLDRHYLIVYAPPVVEDDLAALARARRLQGFQVTMVSTTDLARSGRGRDLGEDIFLWLRDYWEAVEDDGEPVYALLVGRGDAIPVRDIGWLDNDHRDPDGPEYYPAWPTDWYYADLDSGWDANGNGFHGEFLRCPPGGTFPDDEADEGERDCPEEGSLSREGPFGALRGPEDDFKPDIAIGRLAVNAPAEVRAAIDAALAHESGAGTASRSALLAGAFWSFEGRSWREEDRAYQPGGSPAASPWLSSAWDGEKPYGVDAADNLDTFVRQSLELAGVDTYRLYETTSPNGDPSLVPTTRTADAALSGASLADRLALGIDGLVHIAGTGAPDAIHAPHWIHDWDGNAQVDQPAREFFCAGLPVGPGVVGPPCPEILVEEVMQDTLDAPDGTPPLVVANAGSTGAVAYELAGLDGAGNVSGLRYGPEALAGLLPSRGAAAGWVGAFGAVEPGSLDAFQTNLSLALAADPPQRMGDAVWQAAAVLAASEPYDMRSYGVQLFGDPAALYWGGAPDTAGAWPQDGGGWHARGETSRSGPSLPARAWTSRLQPISSAVSVDAEGRLVARAGGGLVWYAPDGTPMDQVSLPGGQASGAAFPPALGADGSVTTAAGSQLHVVDADRQVRSTVLPGAVTGAPRLDPDGNAWVGTTGGMVRVTAVGSSRFSRFGGAAGAAVVLPSGQVAWPTDRGSIVRATTSAEGLTQLEEIAGPGIGTLTELTVGRDGTIYVGSDNGRLYAFPPERAPWNASVGSPIDVRPSVGYEDAVVVAARNGTVVAFAPNSPVERWRNDVGADRTAAAPALDGGTVYVAAGSRLHALDLASGAESWSLDLGADADARSGPVVGADRALYVSLADGSLTALRESGWLAPPTDVSLETSPELGATLRWQDNSEGESGFAAELCTLDGACVQVGEAPPESGSLTVARVPLPEGAPFWARVRALGVAPGAGFAAQEPAETRDSELAPSEPDVVPFAERPSATGLRAEARTAASIELHWSVAGDGAGLLGFTIERRVPGSAYAAVATVGAEARSWLDRGLLSATEYSYRLTTRFEGGTATGGQTAASTFDQAPTGPDDLRALPGRSDITLTWSEDARDEEAWIVERRAPGTAHYRPVGRLGPNATRFVDRVWLDPGRYDYRVYATWEDRSSSVAEIGAYFSGIERLSIFLPFVTKPR